MLGDLFGHLVALQDVLEGSDLKTKLVGDIYQHQNFVSTIAVRVNETLSLQNFDQRFELQIASRRNLVFLATGDSRADFLKERAQLEQAEPNRPSSGGTSPQTPRRRRPADDDDFWKESIEQP
jgi:hypothetical protein